MTCRMTWKRVLLNAVLLASASGAFAQTPAAFPQLDVATTRNSQLLTSVAVDGQGNGNVTLVWSQLFVDGNSSEFARGRRFSASDVPLGPDIAFTRNASSPREAVANQRGDSIVIWNEAGSGFQGALRRTSPVLRQLNLRFSHPVEDVAIDRAGNFVIIWTVSTRDGSRVFGQRYNSDGSKRGPEFNAATNLAGSQFAAGVAMNQRTGEFVVVWLSRQEDNSRPGFFGQRFGFATGRQGSEFQVNTTDLGDDSSRLVADVGRAEDGFFVVAWSRRRAGEFSTDVFGQRFDSSGAKLGGEIVIADDTPITDGYVRLAVAPQGQFVTAWDDGAPPLFVRLYRRDGTPAGPPRELADTIFPGAPELGFGYNNTFVLGWTDFIGIHDPNDDTWEVNYQRFAASPGSEPCLFRNGHFRCDTNGGGEPEVDHLFAVRSGVPLLGDVDADGRDDYCLFRDTRFDCDSGHDYGTAEFTALFGQPGDTPLLGDVDGDGRDEACVFRTNTFLCDTGHNGGTAETTIAFGQAGDRGLMGDVDGDGRDEACVFRVDGFLCDTGHNGGGAETVISSGTPGSDIPLLGDINDDGRDDACFFGVGGVFTCNVSDETVRVRVTGAGRPLIGNVDGL